MSITIKDVDYIATLANLSFEPHEKESLALQMSDIINYMDELNQLPTDHIEPLTAITDSENVLRKDVVIDSLPNEVALSNAPSKIGPFFRVPKVIEQ